VLEKKTMLLQNMINYNMTRIITIALAQKTH